MGWSGHSLISRLGFAASSFACDVVPSANRRASPRHRCAISRLDTEEAWVGGRAWAGQPESRLREDLQRRKSECAIGRG